MKLSKPIKIAGKDVSEIEMRMPNAGELRDVALRDLINLEVDALITVLSRVTNPMMSEQELGDLPVSRLLEMGLEFTANLGK